MIQGKRMVIVYLAGMLLLLISVIAACLLGSADITVGTVLAVLRQELLGGSAAGVTDADVYIIWRLRFPRALLAFAVGGGLAVCGAVMQSITRNVMADPYVLGVSSGALAFVSVGYLAGGAITTTVWFIPTLAFLGSIIALVLVMLVGGFSKDTSPARLVLSGTAVSITLNAVAQYCIYNSQTSNKANSIVSWMMGSLAGARWNNILIPIVGCVAGFLVFFLLSRSFDLIALGDETAVSLGTNVTRIKRLSLTVVAVVAGVSVASCGIIGLVGFVVPHIIRFICGTGHRRLLPMSFLAGGIFLIWMDILARTLLAPQEVPVGIFTALCGGPYFIWILRKRTRKR